MANLSNIIKFTVSSEISNSGAIPHWARLTVKDGGGVAVFTSGDIGIDQAVATGFDVSLPQDINYTLTKQLVADANVITSSVDVPYHSNFERPVVTG